MHILDPTIFTLKANKYNVTGFTIYFTPLALQKLLLWFVVHILAYLGEAYLRTFVTLVAPVKGVV